ncbi:hypothetical protein [Paenibacillus beijingensis]|nr:hypothetical protein [Paenibacillus beijingensis]
MRNKSLKIMILIPVIGIGVWAGTQLPTIADSEAGGLTPGSVDDPVVTKSYVDQKIAAITGGITQPPGTPSDNTGSGSDPSGDDTDAAGIKIVTVPSGQTLLLGDGAEAVVRVGKAVAYSPDTNGVADVTSGEDIKSGQPVANNHLIIFPRGGRGVAPDPGQKNSLTVMVRGEYELKAVPADGSKP